jgi:hypothetical protein
MQRDAVGPAVTQTTGRQEAISAELAATIVQAIWAELWRFPGTGSQLGGGRAANLFDCLPISRRTQA